MNVELVEMTDEQLTALEASMPKQGKPEVYLPCVTELLTKYSNKQGSLAFHWSEVNPNAKPGKTADKNGNFRSERDSVLANLRRVTNDSKTAKGRLTFLRNTDADKITCIIRKAK